MGNWFGPQKRGIIMVFIRDSSELLDFTREYGLETGISAM